MGSLAFQLSIFLRALLNYFGVSTGERTVEYFWMYKHLNKYKLKTILDVGCGNNTRLHAFLLKKNNIVHALDINPPDYIFKGVTFIKGDILNSPYTKADFDVAILISTLEHIGYGAYGDPLVLNGDIKAMQKIVSLSKKDILLSIPFSNVEIKHWFRLFEFKRIMKISEGCIIEEISFYYRKNGWRKISRKKAEFLTSDSSLVLDERGPRCICCIKLSTKG